jgi:hypothetical protein
MSSTHNDLPSTVTALELARLCEATSPVPAMHRIARNAAFTIDIQKELIDKQAAKITELIEQVKRLMLDNASWASTCERLSQDQKR